MAMTRKQRRLVTIGLAGIVLAIAATLILTAAKDKIVFFYGPTELKAMAASPGQRSPSSQAVAHTPAWVLPSAARVPTQAPRPPQSSELVQAVQMSQPARSS